MKKELLRLIVLLVEKKVYFDIDYRGGRFIVIIGRSGQFCKTRVEEDESGMLRVTGTANKNFCGHLWEDEHLCYAEDALKYCLDETLSFPMLELEVKAQKDKSPALRKLYERLCIITADRRRHVREVFENSCWKDFNSFWRKYVGFSIGFADPECEKFHKALYGEFPPQ